MRSQPVELVIFDCDGVLIDSERLAVKAEVQLLGELGWPLSEADVIERFVGRTDLEMRAAIGMRVMAFAGGLTPAELLGGPGTILFDDMWELPRLLEQSGAA